MIAFAGIGGAARRGDRRGDDNKPRCTSGRDSRGAGVLPVTVSVVTASAVVAIIDAASVQNRSRPTDSISSYSTAVINVTAQRRGTVDVQMLYTGSC